MSSGFRSTVTLFGYAPESNRQRPVKSGLPDVRGAGALRFGAPSGVRGRPGVFSLIHWASADPAASVTTPRITSARERRDIGGLPFWIADVSDYIRPPV